MAAATLLTREASRQHEAIELLAGWLLPQVPLEIQRALIGVLAATADPSVPRLLLSRWASAGPEARTAMIDALLRREAWTVELLEHVRKGEELYAIIGAETANSVVLKLADGSTRTVLRDQIERLHGSHVSLMPEGLESGMTQQDLADLIHLLRNPNQTR